MVNAIGPLYRNRNHWLDTDTYRDAPRRAGRAAAVPRPSFLERRTMIFTTVTWVELFLQDVASPQEGLSGKIEPAVTSGVLSDTRPRIPRDVSGGMGVIRGSAQTSPTTPAVARFRLQYDLQHYLQPENGLARECRGHRSRYNGCLTQADLERPGVIAAHAGIRPRLWDNEYEWLIYDHPASFRAKGGHGI